MSTELKIDNNLFNDKKMEELIQEYDDYLVVNLDKDPVNNWLNKLNNDKLENEKNNYFDFYEIILKDILGYDRDDIEYEKNMGDGRYADFTLKKEGKDYVVLELKGTTYKDLNKRYDRDQSPIEQVTNYASIKEETQWAFVSNFNEFRLFNPSYREKYISFKFDKLTDPEVLKKFLLIFSKFSLIEKDIPKTLLKKTKTIERELKDEFYKLFSETRLMLIKELEYSSEDINRLEAIRLSQLILNRFIFLCFAEDLKLIPSETTTDILSTPIKHKNLSESGMWNRLNELFIFANKGNEEREIGAFNGGLFKENLEHLKIRDTIVDNSNFFNDCYKEWKFPEKYEGIKHLFGVYESKLNPIYKNLLLISSFDFGSELSVNILGHIFENSIGDIEELKDQSKTRRKKHGVFYTPEYVTDYICRNTIIPYLSNSEGGEEAKTVHELVSEYEINNSLDELDDKLKNIKIIDPACGSGAFLNKAVDILLDIHKALHDSKYAHDNSLNKYLDSVNRRKQIIVDNIYGVDVNEESVEITKLSLFLKLATTSEIEGGFMLPNLDKNIKYGNSLIDDENLVGNKAFNWYEQFYDIFNSGGFDVVIGNPPYISASFQDDEYKKQRKWLKKSNEYQSLYGGWDYYIAFIEKGTKIFKKDGLLSFIISNSYISSKSSEKSKDYIFENFSFKQLDFFKNIKIFEDASVDNLILTISNSKSKVLCNRVLHDGSFNNIIVLDDNDNIFKIEQEFPFKSKFSNTILLDHICYISEGLNPNSDEEKAKGEFTRDDVVSLVKNKINCKEYVEGKCLKRYRVKYVQYLEWGTERVPNKIRRDTFKELYEFPKIIRGKSTGAIYDDKQLLCNNSCLVLVQYHYLKGINNKSIISNVKRTTKPREELEANSKKFDINYILAILNSNFSFSYLNSIKRSNKKNDFSSDSLKNLPIKFIDLEKQNELSELSKKMTQLNEKFANEVSKFWKWLMRAFNIIELSEKLKKYYKLDVDSFIDEVKNKKVTVKDRKTQESLESEFNKSLKIVIPLKNRIKELDDEINRLVYELYELTDDEIAIIENSLSE